MSGITIGPDGNVEPRQRPSEKPVDYLLVMRLTLRADQVADLEENEEALCERVGNTFKMPVKWVSLEVIR
jgi:hypothetical protein